MKKWLLFLWLLCSVSSTLAQRNPDTEQLGRALEYFTSQKYGEALVILQRLDKQYKLNDRFRAYIGLCYYYEWDYKNAVRYFDEVIDRLGMLSPHEQSVYLFAAAESYFQMQKYEQALAYYERDLPMSYANERGEIYYRIGLCHMSMQHWQAAVEAYRNADRLLPVNDSTKARRAQVKNMLKGCEQKRNEQFVDALKRFLAYQHQQRSGEANPSPSE